MHNMFRTCVVVAIALGTLTMAAPAFAADATTPTVPSQKALAKYRSCMKAHGVNLSTNPRPSTPPSTGENGAPRGGFDNPNGSVPANLPKGVTSKKFQAAQKACASKLPGGSGGFGQQNPAQFQAYLSCLKDHGVTVPTNGGLRGLDRNDPTFQAANQVCGVLLPSQPGSGAGGTTSTTRAAST